MPNSKPSRNAKYPSDTQLSQASSPKIAHSISRRPIKILLIGKRHKDEEAAMNDKEQVTEEEQLHILNDIQANLTNYAIKKYRVEATLRGVKPLDEDKSRNKP
jgi:hypothetical protein